jgi:biopolymer transport protein ExbD
MLTWSRSYFGSRSLCQALSAMRLWAMSAVVLLVAALAGCAAEQPRRTVRLEILANATYLVDGSPAEKNLLAAALSSKGQPNSKLLVLIVPQNGAPYEAVRGAVEAARNAGANMGMIGNTLW